MLTNTTGSLSLIIWLPIVFGILVLAVGGEGADGTFALPMCVYEVSARRFHIFHISL